MNEIEYIPQVGDQIGTTGDELISDAIKVMATIDTVGVHDHRDEMLNHTAFIVEKFGKLYVEEALTTVTTTKWEYSQYYRKQNFVAFRYERELNESEKKRFSKKALSFEFWKYDYIGIACQFVRIVTKVFIYPFNKKTNGVWLRKQKPVDQLFCTKTYELAFNEAIPNTFANPETDTPMDCAKHKKFMKVFTGKNATKIKV